MSIRIHQLFYHPIKSLGGISTNCLSVRKEGPLRDRQMMLVNSDGKFVTQRQKPLMSQIKVFDLGDQLKLSFNQDSIELDWPDFSGRTERKTVQVWQDELEAQVIHGEVNNWLSELLKQDVQLVYKHEDTYRQVDLDYARKGDETGFSDGFPFLLISQASIDFLQSHLDVSISMERFRPNISVTGYEPFEEDNWKRIAINGVEFDLVKPCSRCVIPTIDLESGEKQKQVMQVMLEHRKRGSNVYVGQNLLHRGEGELNVGDTLEILETY